MRVWRFVLVVLVAVAAALSMTTAPASAARETFKDRANDAHRGVDITSVKVVNQHRVRVRTKFDYLKDRECGSTGLTVYVDTRRRNPGPEYYVSGALFCEWQAFRINSWHDRTPRLLFRCDVNLRAREGRGGTATYSFDRGCLRRPDEIRVAAVAAGTGRRNDWAPRHRTFYPTVDHR